MDMNPSSGSPNHESQPLTRSRSLRIVLVVAGWASLVTGFIGIFLPVLPTTPFLLLAAACFARSSPRFYEMLLAHRWFGPPIRDWRTHRAISMKTKVMAISLMAATLGTSIVLFIPIFAVKLLLAAIGLGVAAYIARLPTRRAASNSLHSTDQPETKP